MYFSLLCPGFAATGIVVANTGSKTTPWFHDWQEFRHNVDEKSNGSILLDYLIFGEMGTAQTMLDAVISGRANLGNFSCQTLTRTIPEIAVTEMPFLFNSEEEADYVFDRALLPIFSDLAAQQGLVLLQWTETGWMNVYSKTPVQFPSQLANQLVRSSPNIVGPLYLSALQAETVTATLNEILSPLQAEKMFAGLGSIIFYELKAQSVFKYFTKTRHAYDCGVLVANKQWLESLPPEEQKILRSSFPSTVQTRKNIREASAKLFQTLPKTGTTVLDLSPEEHNAWAASALPLYPRMLQEIGGQANTVYNSIRTAQKAYVQDSAAQPAH